MRKGYERAVGKEENEGHNRFHVHRMGAMGLTSAGFALLVGANMLLNGVNLEQEDDIDNFQDIDLKIAGRWTVGKMLFH